MKPKLGPDASGQVRTAMDSTPDDVKLLYKVKSEMRVAMQSLLKVCSRLTLSGCYCSSSNVTTNIKVDSHKFSICCSNQESVTMGLLIDLGFQWGKISVEPLAMGRQHVLPGKIEAP